MLYEPELQDVADSVDNNCATKLAMFGERSSGLAFVEELITLNFPHLHQTEEFGWKHGFINPGYMRDDTIFVAVVRGALDWLREFYVKPEQLGGWHKDLPFSEFIRHEWSSSVRGRVLGKPNRKLGLSRHAELMHERHPLTGARIPNVIELRNLKLQSLLKLEKMTSNVAILRYEDVRDAPEEMMFQLQDRLGLPSSDEILQIEEEPVNQDLLPEICDADLSFIASELNLHQELAYGYQYEL